MERNFCFCCAIRVNQLEVSPNQHIGFNEREANNYANLLKMRAAIDKVGRFPITWALSYQAIVDKSEEFIKIRAKLKEYHAEYGDDVTLFVGCYFANAYNTVQEVNEHMGFHLAKIREFMGEGYNPKSVIAGFLSAKNQQYLSQVEDIHVVQGTIYSQYSIDNQDGEGSICYPYFPSLEHFNKPAQSNSDFIDCVCLDGWTVDFFTSRTSGIIYTPDYLSTKWLDYKRINSRMGVGPIESVLAYGERKGLEIQMNTIKTHYENPYNDFAYITVIWELDLLKGIPNMVESNCYEQAVTNLFYETHKTYPDTNFTTHGDFGLKFRSQYKNNDDYNYVFVQKGFKGFYNRQTIFFKMNKNYRLGIIKKRRLLTNKCTVKVFDYINYADSFNEPQFKGQPLRNWSIMGEINQKGLRQCDKPILVEEFIKNHKDILSENDLKIINEQ